MIKVMVLSAVVGDGKTEQTSFRPRFADDFNLSWQDATDARYPNTKEAVVIQVTCTEQELVAIESNPEYYVISTEAV